MLKLSFSKATAFDMSLLCIYISVCMWKIFLLKVESSIKWWERDNHLFTLVFVMASHVGRQHNGVGIGPSQLIDFSSQSSVC